MLDQLGLSARLRGSGPQRRGPCPLHRGDGRGRTFSVNLEANVFQCFDKECGQKGDVIDLWAALHGMSLREAALDLVRTFDLEPAPVRSPRTRRGTVKERLNGRTLDAASTNPHSLDACIGEAARAADRAKPTKNPVITKTGLDILRYICSAWFGIYSRLFTSHARTCSAASANEGKQRNL